MQKTVQHTWKPTAAGILEIVGGSGSIIFALILFAGSIALNAASTWAGFNEQDFAPLSVSAVAALMGLGALTVAALGILEVIGGIFALQRKVWGLAVAGSIAAALPMNVLGILAIVFLAISKDEFASRNDGQKRTVTVT